MFNIETPYQIDEIIDPLFSSKGIKMSIARLDLIHSIVSGNKLFKLHYFIKEAIEKNISTIITFGGAYSNHLVATAYYTNSIGLDCYGIVRGEEPENYSHTLLNCLKYNMKLLFIPREKYDDKNKNTLLTDLNLTDFKSMVIPEGGYHPLGAAGASIIMNQLHKNNYSHICTAVGTATTLAGLLQNVNPTEKIIAVPVIKKMNDLESRITYLSQHKQIPTPVVFDHYHVGGYAKKNDALLDFMNNFYKNFSIQTDFIYTGKMLYALYDQIKNNYFKEGSSIACLHTGGIQGNLSLPADSLFF